MVERAAYVAAAAASILAAAGCIPPIPEGFDSPDPAMRLRAIAEAGERRDTSAVPDLIEQLESTDPGARLLAIRALERITGETLGYDYAAPLWARGEAVDRWRRWYEQHAAPSGPPTPHRNP